MMIEGNDSVFRSPHDVLERIVLGHQVVQKVRLD
jgi:hypothetical protein